MAKQRKLIIDRTKWLSGQFVHDAYAVTGETDLLYFPPHKRYSIIGLIFHQLDPTLNLNYISDLHELVERNSPIRGKVGKLVKKLRKKKSKRYSYLRANKLWHQIADWSASDSAPRERVEVEIVVLLQKLGIHEVVWEGEFDDSNDKLLNEWVKEQIFLAINPQEFIHE